MINGQYVSYRTVHVDYVESVVDRSTVTMMKDVKLSNNNSVCNMSFFLVSLDNIGSASKIRPTTSSTRRSRQEHLHFPITGSGKSIDSFTQPPSSPPTSSIPSLVLYFSAKPCL